MNKETEQKPSLAKRRTPINVCGPQKRRRQDHFNLRLFAGHEKAGPEDGGFQMRPGLY